MENSNWLCHYSTGWLQSLFYGMVTSRTAILSVSLAITSIFLSPAHAAVVQFNSGGTAATGIIGLDVGGTFYDVDFTGSITHNNWATMLDVNTLSDATTVIGAIATALDSAAVTLLEYDTPSGGVFEFNSTTLYYGTNSTSLLGVGINSFFGSNWGSFIGGSTSPLNDSFPLAVDLTPSAVPVPAAVWLFGSGLIGLVGVAKRKKNASY